MSNNNHRGKDLAHHMDIRNRIGITTYYRYNYGSILQCYATCEVLRQEGYEPTVLNVRSGKMVTLAKMAHRCMTHPRHIRAFYSLWTAQRRSSLGSLSVEGLSMMERFVHEYLPVEDLSVFMLRQIGKSPEYRAFLSGSDQIWNGHQFLVSPHYFLRFAPKHKRIAWAPSFGTADIASYNRLLYKKYLSQYSALSVREEQGIALMEGLTGITPVQLIDPVFLLKKDEWAALTTKNVQGKYVLLYFLNDPSNRTIERIAAYCSRESISPIVFGSMRDVYQKLPNCQTMDGGPIEFLSMIRHAYCLLTDSFHGTSFAIIFHTPFVAHKRNYTHRVDQSSRLQSILRMCHMEEAFEPQELKAMDYPFDYADTVIANKRAEMLDYLQKSIDKAQRRDEE